ncbi:MAG: hypothetical protein Q9187_003897 [Circinaria calcarea]
MAAKETSIRDKEREKEIAQKGHESARKTFPPLVHTSLAVKSLNDQVSTKPRTSSLTAAWKQPAVDAKTTSLKGEADSRNAIDGYYKDKDVFEDDDNDNDWEDSEDPTADISENQPLSFQRVDSKLTLVSRRPMITTLIDQPDRAMAVQASKSRSVLPQPRNSSSISSVGSSLEDESTLEMNERNNPRSKPIVMTSSNTHQYALSPRTFGHEMVTSELTESLRKCLIWQRSQMNATANAVLRRQTAPVGTDDISENNFDTNEYHSRGW